MNQMIDVSKRGTIIHNTFLDSAPVKSWMPMFTYIFSLLNAVPMSFNRMEGQGKTDLKFHVYLAGGA